MGGLTPAELCRRHDRIGIDSNVFIYLLEGVEPWASQAAAVVGAIEAGLTSAYLATVGLTEILTGAARVGDLGRLEQMNDEVHSLPGLRIAPLSAEVATDAAVIRGVRGVALPDAIHLATARAVGATAFLTNDRRIRGSAKLEIVYLDDIRMEAD